ncbi:MAG TPA: class I SAM-dependent methyltransferase [Lachnospiraceae bacterium]
MQLSNRLLAIADMVSPSSRLVDVGTDHAYIPIYLCRQERIPSAIAMDINKGPLQRARENIELFHLEEKIQTRLSDGIEKLEENEADSMVIAGMGGNLVLHILGQKKEVVQSLKELILQPQSEIKSVRKYLSDNGFEIFKETILLEDGKYYPMMRVAYTGKKQRLLEVELEYGPLLLRKKDKILKEYLEKQKKSLQNILENLQKQKSQGSIRGIQQIAKKQRLLWEGLAYYEER